MIKWLDSFLRWWAKATTCEAAYQLCHFLIAYCAQLTFGPKHKWITAGAVLAFATWKEGWQDVKYEKDPFWAWPGGLMDWTFYQLGTLAAFLRFALLGTALAAAPCAYRMHGSVALNDLTCTPGVVRTTDLRGTEGICTTSTKNYRHTTAEMKKQVCLEYGVKNCPHKDTMEEDHLIPLEAGGADSVQNLWIQPAPQYHWKDRLENFIHAEVCSGKMDVKEAQKKIAEDWYAFYLELHCDKFCEVK